MNKTHRTLIHAGFWIFITASFIWLPGAGKMPELEFYRTVALLVLQVLAVIAVIFFLSPFYFAKGKKASFFTFGLSFLVLCGIFMVYLFPGVLPHLSPHQIEPGATQGLYVRFFTAIFPIFAAMAIAAFWEIWEHVLAGEKRNIQLAREKSETELKMLKSQINPHFLLNALNNIYSLSVLRAQETSEYIMLLSEMLKYVIYECEKTTFRWIVNSNTSKINKC